jgi:hypothetical protein
MSINRKDAPARTSGAGAAKQDQRRMHGEVIIRHVRLVLSRPAVHAPAPAQTVPDTPGERTGAMLERAAEPWPGRLSSD